MVVILTPIVLMVVGIPGVTCVGPNLLKKSRATTVPSPPLDSSLERPGFFRNHGPTRLKMLLKHGSRMLKW